LVPTPIDLARSPAVCRKPGRLRHRTVRGNPRRFFWLSEATASLDLASLEAPRMSIPRVLRFEKEKISNDSCERNPDRRALGAQRLA